MIVKFFELKKKELKCKNFLLYGNNKGLIEETIENSLKPSFPKNVYTYEESEILKNPEVFKEEIYNKSFFENEKLIIISRASDKIQNLMHEIIEKKISDLSIIIKSNALDKKSKMRNYFEKSNLTACVAFYEDNFQTLNQIAQNFLKEKKMNISQENINLLIDRSQGDRINLNNELKKLELFSMNKKNVNSNQIQDLSNLAENYSIAELIDNTLSQNNKKTTTILNENNFSPDDGILILRVMLSKLKRLSKIQKEIKSAKDIDGAIASFKPPIFWKEKEIVKRQIKTWDYEQIKNLIWKTNNVELLAKKNPLISMHIITDFILAQSIRN
tara:strand:- start:534 stop:1520 length:987 start_codon:yes stop_codon:yes gene_type:complete